jgi:hypothetical protein
MKFTSSKYVLPPTPTQRYSGGIKEYEIGCACNTIRETKNFSSYIWKNEM